MEVNEPFIRCLAAREWRFESIEHIESETIYSPVFSNVDGLRWDRFNQKTLRA